VREEDVLAFIRTSISSVWALELLLLVKRNKHRAWHANELVTELRSSSTAIKDAIGALRAAGVVGEENGLYRYQPASPALDEMIVEVARMYALKPLVVIKTIAMAPNERLRIFANSFKLKE
jgi:biotin operon repressor